MNEIILKDIKKISNKYRDYNNYIDIVRYIVFLISKVFFCYKGKCLILEKDNLNKILKEKNNLDGENLFDQYNMYDIKDNIVIEEVINVLLKYNSSSVNSNDFIPGVLYEKMLSDKEKKYKGQVYTPNKIIDLMYNEMFKHIIIDNKMKILDPACGGGFFLIEALKRLRKVLAKDDKITSIRELDKHIIENMIYGNDMDEFSVFLTKTGLLFNSMCDNAKFNISNDDFLLMKKEKFGCKFNLIIGNPPYIGHKKLDKSYKKILNEMYKEVYYDKSDISYCFFYKSKELIKDNGYLSFITSRYFKEAKYADRLRLYLKENFSILAIKDFNGNKIYKNINVSPAIISLMNRKICNNKFKFSKINSDLSIFKSYKYNQSNLDRNPWRILNKEEERIFKKIDDKCNIKLKDICEIRQGIITGCDKAFIVSEKEIETYKLEMRLIKRWIKNSDVKKESIIFNDKYIIYSDLINDKDKYPNTINYLGKYKQKLLLRRECERGIRKWYELQWGRKLEMFESPKIVFPFKANRNKFYYDESKYLCSADIYFITNLRTDISYKYITAFLNSKIFEYYFKCVAKKIGIKSYEYYPNKLENLGIFLAEDQLMKNIENNENDNIDKMLFKVFNIKKDEEKIIEGYINN